MLRYSLRRIGLALVIALLAVSFLFVMIRAAPGDPASILLGPRATPEIKAELSARMGLDKPLPAQLMIYFSGLARGDLGIDVFSNRPVARIVGEQLPFTLELIFSSILWSAFLGVLLGCYSACRRNSAADRLLAVLSVAFVSTPAFVVALYLLLVFAVALQWLPAIGAGEPGDFVDRARHLVLPSLAIGIGWVGYIARLVRASMLEVLAAPHIRVARAFGLPPRWIVFRYALRVAILPVVALLGVGMGFLLSAAVFAEVVFARPGIGKLIIDSISTRNYPVVMGGVLVSTLLFVASTAVADIVNAALDPRARADR